MVTQAQRNAALLACHGEAMKIITHFVPTMFASFAETYLASHPELIRNISDACLNAADAVASPPSAPTPPIGVSIPVPPSPLAPPHG